MFFISDEILNRTGFVDFLYFFLVGFANNRLNLHTFLGLEASGFVIVWNQFIVHLMNIHVNNFISDQFYHIKFHSSFSSSISSQSSSSYIPSSVSSIYLFDFEAIFFLRSWTPSSISRSPLPLIGYIYRSYLQSWKFSKLKLHPAMKYMIYGLSLWFSWIFSKIYKLYFEQPNSINCLAHWITNSSS